MVAAKGNTQVAECIHGLEIPLCDICYPKAVPEKPRASRPAAAPRAPRAASVTTSRRSVNAGEQRIYHVTHIRNLEAIAASGALTADAAPTVDLSTALTRELRKSVPVPAPTAAKAIPTTGAADTDAADTGTVLAAGTTPGAAEVATVADYVPFYLAPDATLWADLRAGALDDSRWSDAARKPTPADFVFLVSTIAAIGDGAVIADGDAAATFTRFFSGDGIQRAIERLHGDDDARRAAEALAPHAVPFSSVQLIGVANDRVRDRVRDLLRGAGGLAPKVAVYPPWFQPA
ncbi:hypothetical protein BH11ACT4_BH11ACT4_23610 [soil metagenome]